MAQIYARLLTLTQQRTQADSPCRSELKRSTIHNDELYSMCDRSERGSELSNFGGDSSPISMNKNKSLLMDGKVGEVYSQQTFSKNQPKAPNNHTDTFKSHSFNPPPASAEYRFQHKTAVAPTPASVAVKQTQENNLALSLNQPFISMVQKSILGERTFNPNFA